MKRIMVRYATDDFHAMQIAQGMENAGANVFSIANNGSSTYPNAMAPHCSFVVFAKVDSDDMISGVDDAIAKEVSA